MTVNHWVAGSSPAWGAIFIFASNPFKCIAKAKNQINILEMCMVRLLLSPQNFFNMGFKVFPRGFYSLKSPWTAINEEKFKTHLIL